MAKAKKQSSGSMHSSLSGKVISDKAIEVSKPSEIKAVSTYADAVATFCATVPDSAAQDVRAAVSFIHEVQAKMVENVLAIGDKLKQLRLVLGADSFSTFVRTVLPKMGISKSTAYRWLGLADSFVGHFPNPAVRAALIAHTDGRGIISEDKDKKTIALTPAFEAGMKLVGSAPTGTLNANEAEQYAIRLITASRKARTEARTGNGKHGAQAKAADRVYKLFSKFVGKYGTKAGESLVGRFDKLLTVSVGGEEDESKAA